LKTLLRTVFLSEYEFIDRIIDPIYTKVKKEDTEEEIKITNLIPFLLNLHPLYVQKIFFFCVRYLHLVGVYYEKERQKEKYLKIKGEETKSLEIIEGENENQKKVHNKIKQLYWMYFIEFKNLNKFMKFKFIDSLRYVY
jgi:hypothetical protein